MRRIDEVANEIKKVMDDSDNGEVYLTFLMEYIDDICLTQMDDPETVFGLYSNWLLMTYSYNAGVDDTLEFIATQRIDL